MSVKKLKKNNFKVGGAVKFDTIGFEYLADTPKYKTETIEDIVNKIGEITISQSGDRINPTIKCGDCPLEIRDTETLLQIVIPLNDSKYTQKTALDLFNDIFTDWGSIGFWGNYNIDGGKIYLNIVANTINMQNFVLFINESPNYKKNWGNDKKLGNSIKCSDSFVKKQDGGADKISEIRWFLRKLSKRSDQCYIVVNTDFYAILAYLRQKIKV